MTGADSTPESAPALVPPSIPTLDAALCVELGRRTVLDLMTQQDWHNVLDRIAHWMDTDAPMPDNYDREANRDS